MDKQQLISYLKDMGITTENCSPKSSFVRDSQVVVGLYPREFIDIFYFFNKYDKKIYSYTKPDERSLLSYNVDTETGKYLVPLADCKIVWEDKPFEEKPDLPFKDITLRQYACIHLKVADTGIPWLDTLINKAK